MEKGERTLLRAGFLLVLLALLTGLVVQSFRNPRMGVSAHLEGIMNGLLLVAAGLAWSHFRLSAGQARTLRGLLLYAAYVNWGTTSLSAAWGTSRLTPIAGAGFVAQEWQETIGVALGVSIAITAVAAVGMMVYALRKEGPK